jgi:hypothetical protein
MLPLACLTLGVLLGLIGGLKVAATILAGMTRRLEELERERISQKG